MRYLLSLGHDLPGNLIIGDKSVERFIDTQDKCPPRSSDDYDDIVRKINEADFGYSSVAGEKSLLVKFS